MAKDKTAVSNKKRLKFKICFISSSGGHFEQLKMLKPLCEKYNSYWVTEKTKYDMNTKYTLPPGYPNKVLNILALALNMLKSLFLIIKERPKCIISTGTLVAFPTILFARLFRIKVIYIETFARVYGGTKAARFVYHHKLYDLFMYQWETQKDEFPEGICGGGIY